METPRDRSYPPTDSERIEQLERRLTEMETSFRTWKSYSIVALVAAALFAYYISQEVAAARQDIAPVRAVADELRPLLPAIRSAASTAGKASDAGGRVFDALGDMMDAATGNVPGKP